MEKRIVVDSSFDEETRVAFINGSEIEHFEVDTSSNKKQLKGNVYLAKVSRVEPSLQAAFINYGGNKQGFLPYSEINNDYFKIPEADKSKTSDEFIVKDFYRDSDKDGNKRKPPRRIPNFKRYKIQEVIKKNQIMLVQVVKDERGNKGAALTTFISIAGKYCVLMPNKSLGTKISKKISDFKERKKLIQIASKCKLTKEMGLIVRTASRDCDENNLKKDFDYVLGIWKSIKEKTINSLAPTLINEDSNIVNKFIRDSFIEEYKDIVIEGEQTYERAKKYMKTLLPDQEKKIKQYKNTKLPIMEFYDLEKKINSIYDSKVRLKSGGYIIINSTEALTAIDINSGQSTKESNVEETALKTNIEAVDEISRQIKIRDLSGLIVIDFIDMINFYNRKMVEKKLRDKLKDDRARIQFGRISNFGLLEMTRQRLRESSIKWRMTLSLDSFALKIVKKSEELAFSNKAKITNIYIPEKVKAFIEKNLAKEINFFKKKYKLEFNLISYKNYILPEYRIELLNKNKKIIKKVESFQKLDKDFIKPNFKKKNFIHKKYYRGKKKFNN